MLYPSDTFVYEIIPVVKNTGVRFFTSHDPGSYVPPHWHDAVEIVYMQKGTLDYIIEGHTLLLHPGECVLLNANIVHSTKCTAPNTAIVFQIPISFFEAYVPHVHQLLFRLDNQNADPVYTTKRNHFKDTLERMQLINDNRPEDHTLLFNSMLFDIMFQLCHNFSVRAFQANLTQRGKDLSRLSAVLKYTEEHYNEPISIAEIAEVAFLQAGYFCRFFKKCMGVTYLEYQNELRLSYIYRDLITTKDPIHQILEKHGFTNYKLFRRMFQEHFHATPSQIRKNIATE
ncbi:MAG: AraC family transcriptional regulator [Eubacteriales bacterium]|nr:AraC family transcriptional regulator [Eubacteriales bacterium]